MTGTAVVRTRKPIRYGISCSVHRCRECFDNSSLTRSYSMAIEETHAAAGKVGWTLGLDPEGQAHYLCPDHAGSLYCENTLEGLFSRRQKSALRRRTAPAAAKTGGAQL